ncbi:MAG: glycosyltransferase [Rikenellaceae bacterium]
MRFSIIIPLYNRPEEIKELLESLLLQDFLQQKGAVEQCEIVVVEDGSDISSAEIVENFSDRLPVKYFVKENGGPASARNYAAERSGGQWLIFLDSDTVLPSGWLSSIAEGVRLSEMGEIAKFDAFGGPDRASADFTPVQKAINYSMTSVFTTGGIRGGKKSMEKFHPRSFNMGISREVFEKLGGFDGSMRFGEDVDLSIRIFESGANCVLLPDAWVYHKRRVDFRKFYRQVRASGGARITLSRKHKGSLKLVHLMPLGFTLYFFAGLVLSPLCYWVGVPFAVWSSLIIIDATIRTGGIEMGILSLWASVVQLLGYGIGFLKALFGGGKNLDKKFYK